MCCTKPRKGLGFMKLKIIYVLLFMNMHQKLISSASTKQTSLDSQSIDQSTTILKQVGQDLEKSIEYIEEYKTRLVNDQKAAQSLNQAIKNADRIQALIKQVSW